MAPRSLGVRLKLDELKKMGVPASIGSRFETNLLDVLPGVYEVVHLDARQAIVRRVAQQGEPAAPSTAEALPDARTPGHQGEP